MSKIDIRWLKHVNTDEARAKVKESIGNSSTTLQLLTDILQAELDEKEKSSTEDYKIPNWQCYQADRNGYKRAIKSFIHLLNIKED